SPQRGQSLVMSRYTDDHHANLIDTVSLHDALPVCRLAAGARCAGRCQVDGDLLRVGSAQVVDHDVVGATQCIEPDLLDIIEVHGDACDIAEEAHASAVG